MEWPARCGARFGQGKRDRPRPVALCFVWDGVRLGRALGSTVLTSAVEKHVPTALHMNSS
jgi:hypothetical protein